MLADEVENGREGASISICGPVCQSSIDLLGSTDVFEKVHLPVELHIEQVEPLDPDYRPP